MNTFVTILKWIAYVILTCLVAVPVGLATGYGMTWYCDKLIKWLKLA